MKNSERIEWIDNLKGFGVIFIMLYHHTGISGFAKNYLISFNVPLFFVTFGYLLSSKKNQVTQACWVSSFKRIIYPYLFFSIMSILLRVLASYSTIDMKSITNMVIGVVYGVSSPPWLSFNDALWFLPCLFVSDLIFSKIRNCGTQWMYILIPCLILLAVAGFSFRLPWGIDVAPMAMVFIVIGYIVHQKNMSDIVSSKYVLDILLATAIISYLVVSFNGHIGMGFKYYGHTALFVLGACSGILFWYIVSKYYSGFISVIGRHSLVLFSMHLPVYLLLNRLFFSVLGVSLDLTHVSSAILYVCLAISLLLPVSVFLGKYVPSLVGLRR